MTVDPFRKRTNILQAKISLVWETLCNEQQRKDNFIYLIVMKITTTHNGNGLKIAQLQLILVFMYDKKSIKKAVRRRTNAYALRNFVYARGPSVSTAI